MEIFPDLIDLLRALNNAKARYLVVGAHAVAFHGEPRSTQDFDLLVEPTVENAQRVWKGLMQFGAPLSDMSKADFANPSLVYQIGVPPHRIDILMGVDGVSFVTAWKRRVSTKFGGEPVYVLGRNDLIRAKRAAGRPQDLLDIAKLKRATRAIRKKRKK